MKHRISSQRETIFTPGRICSEELYGKIDVHTGYVCWKWRKPKKIIKIDISGVVKSIEVPIFKGKLRVPEAAKYITSQYGNESF